MAILHGNDLLIMNSSGTALIAGSISCEIDKQCEMIEVANPTTGTARTYMAGRTDWTINVNYLVSSTLSDIVRVGQSVTIRVKERNSNTYLQGSAFFQTCHITATRGNLSQGTFVLKGSGPLTPVTP